MTKRLRCVMIDDFQEVALNSADWSALLETLGLVSVAELSTSEDELFGLIVDPQMRCVKELGR